VIAGTSTNLYGAFIEGIDVLDDAPTSGNRLKAGSLVVFTDGRERTGISTIGKAEAAVEGSD